jgi:hypothetical protein
MHIGALAAGPFGTGASVALGINSDVYGSVPIGNRHDERYVVDGRRRRR